MRPSPTWLRRWVFGLGTVLVAVLLSAADAVATPFHYKEFSQGAIVQWTSCPELPPTVTLCHDYAVWYARFDGAAGDRAVGPTNRGKQPFEALYEDFAYRIGPDGEGEDVSFTVGHGAAVAGYYDKTHLTRAGMGAVTLPLMAVDRDTGAETPTGGTVALGQFRWTAGSPVYRYPNNGPVFSDEPRHVSGRCRTFSSSAHQKFTLGYVTGTVDGVPLTELSLYSQVDGLEPEGAPGGIFNNWFHIVDLAKRC